MPACDLLSTCSASLDVRLTPLSLPQLCLPRLHHTHKPRCILPLIASPRINTPAPLLHRLNPAVIHAPGSRKWMEAIFNGCHACMHCLA
jgi:hypothetical protein